LAHTYSEQSKQNRNGEFVYHYPPDRYPLFALVILFFILITPTSGSAETIHLQRGFNLFSYPSEPSSNLYCAELQSKLGATRLSRLNLQTQLLEHCSELEFPILPGIGYSLDLAAEGSFDFEEVASCPSLDLVAGMNLISVPTPAEGMSCYDLLEAIGNAEVVSAIQRFDAVAGRYQSCAYDHSGLSDMPLGTEFPIIQGEAYWVSMLQARQDLLLNDDSLCQPLPEITSIYPPGGLPAQVIAHFQVTGNRLHDAVFLFIGGANPPLATTAPIINSEGTSANLSVSIDLNAGGLYTVTASNGLGISSNIPGPGNSFRILNPDDDEDHDGLSNAEEQALGTDMFNPNTDGDDFSDGMEVEAGSDPLDETSFPVTPNLSIGEAVSLPFSVLNTVNPSEPAPGDSQDPALFVGAASSLSFSVLNTVNPGEPTPGETQDPALFVGAASILSFSVLNTVDPGQPAPGEPQDPALFVGAASSLSFSVLNTVDPGQAAPGEPQDPALFVGEAIDLPFSVLNKANPSQPPVGDPTDPDLFVGEAISDTFSVEVAE